MKFNYRLRFCTMSIGQLTAHGEPQRLMFRTLKVRSVGGRKTQPFGKLIFPSVSRAGSFRCFPPEISSSFYVVWNTCFPPLSYCRRRVMNTWSHADMTEFTQTSCISLVVILQFKVTLTPCNPQKKKKKYSLDNTQTSKLPESPSTKVNSLSLSLQVRQLNSDIHEFTPACWPHMAVCVCICVYVCLWDWQLNSESQPMERAEPPDDCLNINPLLETPLKASNNESAFIVWPSHSLKMSLHSNIKPSAMF